MNLNVSSAQNFCAQNPQGKVNSNKKKALVALGVAAAGVAVTAGLYAIGKNSPKFTQKLETMVDDKLVMYYQQGKASLVKGVKEGVSQLKETGKKVINIVKDKELIMDGPSKLTRIKDAIKSLGKKGMAKFGVSKEAVEKLFSKVAAK